MVTEEITKNQEKEAQLLDAKYTVVVSGGGATCEEKPILEALLPGIRLHFLRYGLFEKENKEVNALRIKDKEDDQFTLEDADASNGPLQSNESFRVMTTYLREGFVYLINQEDKNDFHELAVNPYGEVYPIIWNKKNLKEDGTTPNDFRTPEKEGKHYKLVAKTEKEVNKKYWIGFSPVQWSYSLHNKILNGSDDDKKKMQMILIECNGIKKEEESPEHIFAYNKVQIGYYKNEHVHRKIESTLKQIHQTESREEKRGDNDLYEDMFIALHDPVGCAEDISEVLSHKILDFKALTEAIQTGETIEEALSRLLDSTQPKPSIDKTYQDMFSLALVSYKMVYSNKKNTKKYDGGNIGSNFGDTNFPYQPNKEATYEYSFNPYSKGTGMSKRQTNNYVPNEHIGYGLHREKVEGILGVHERREKRALINTFRDAYGDFIQTDYLKTGLLQYTENSQEHFLSGVARFYSQLLLLYNNPCDIDRHLLLTDNDLEQDVYQSTDRWIDWVESYVKSKQIMQQDALQKLLVEDLVISDTLLQQWTDLSNKFAAATYARIEIHSRIAYKAKVSTSPTTGKINYQKILRDRQQYVLDTLNKITVKKTESGEVVKAFIFGNTHQIEMNAGVFGVAFDPNLEVVIEAPGKSPQTIVADHFKHQRIYGKKSIAAGGNHSIIIGDQVENVRRTDYQINHSNAKRFNEKAARFLNSRGFTGVLTALQIVNFGNSVLDVFSDNQTKIQLAKNLTNAIGISAELTEASLRLQAAHYRAISKTVTGSLEKQIVRAGAIGGAVTSGMCIWEGAVAFNKRDDDAGAAWIGAGVAFGISTAAGLWGSSALLLSGPVGWIALGIGFALVALAYIFTDSDLEYFFKNFILSDLRALPKQGENPMHYNRLVFSSRKKLVDYEDKDVIDNLTHPTDAIAYLHDILVCNNVTYYVPRESFSKKVGHGRNAYYIAYEIGVRIKFNQFLSNKEQLEPIGILFASDDQRPIEFQLEICNSSVKALENGQKELVAQLAIPTQYRNQVQRLSRLAIAIRIRIDATTNHYFPYPKQNEKKRYLGARFNLWRGIRNRTAEREQELIFNTLTEMKKENTW